MTKSVGMMLAVGLCAIPVGAAVTGQLQYPDGFRRWTHISSGYVGNESPAFERFGGLHYIYANSRALAGYRGATFPDGSVLVFDVHNVKEGDGTIAATTRRQVDVMEKTGGRWTFAEFQGDSRTQRNIAVDEGRASCAKCHSGAEHDHVFSKLEN